MSRAANYPIVADRWTPFVMTFAMVGLNLTDATFKAQVRTVKDQSAGTALVTLNTVTTDIEGVRLSDYRALTAEDVEDFAAMGVTVALGQPCSWITIRIAEATMTALSVAEARGMPGADGPAYWDLHITPSGGDKYVAFAGSFTIKAGVTQ